MGFEPMQADAYQNLSLTPWTTRAPARRHWLDWKVTRLAALTRFHTMTSTLWNPLLQVFPKKLFILLLIACM